MEFAFHGTVPPELEEFRVGIEAALVRRGYTMLDTPDDATLVLNFIDADPRPFRRVAKSTFVASIWAENTIPAISCRTRIRCSCARSRISPCASSPGARRAS